MTYRMLPIYEDINGPSDVKSPEDAVKLFCRHIPLYESFVQEEASEASLPACFEHSNLSVSRDHAEECRGLAPNDRVSLHEFALKNVDNYVGNDTFAFCDAPMQKFTMDAPTYKVYAPAALEMHKQQKAKEAEKLRAAQSEDCAVDDSTLREYADGLHNVEKQLAELESAVVDVALPEGEEPLDEMSVDTLADKAMATLDEASVAVESAAEEDNRTVVNDSDRARQAELVAEREKDKVTMLQREKRDTMDTINEMESVIRGQQLAMEQDAAKFDKAAIILKEQQDTIKQLETRSNETDVLINELYGELKKRTDKFNSAAALINDLHGELERQTGKFNSAEALIKELHGELEQRDTKLDQERDELSRLHRDEIDKHQQAQTRMQAEHEQDKEKMRTSLEENKRMLQSYTAKHALYEAQQSELCHLRNAHESAMKKLAEVETKKNAWYDQYTDDYVTTRGANVDHLERIYNQYKKQYAS